MGGDSVVNRLILDDITTTNATGRPMPLVYNKGKINYLSMKRIDSGDDDALVNAGEIGTLDN